MNSDERQQLSTTQSTLHSVHARDSEKVGYVLFDACYLLQYSSDPWTLSTENVANVPNYLVLKDLGQGRRADQKFGGARFMNLYNYKYIYTIPKTTYFFFIPKTPVFFKPNFDAVPKTRVISKDKHKYVENTQSTQICRKRLSALMCFTFRNMPGSHTHETLTTCMLWRYITFKLATYCSKEFQEIIQ